MQSQVLSLYGEKTSVPSANANRSPQVTLKPSETSGKTTVLRVSEEKLTGTDGVQDGSKPGKSPRR